MWENIRRLYTTQNLCVGCMLGPCSTLKFCQSHSLCTVANTVSTPVARSTGPREGATLVPEFELSTGVENQKSGPTRVETAL